MYNHPNGQINYLGESVNPNSKPRRSVYLEGANTLYSAPNTATTKVAPAPVQFFNQNAPVEAFSDFNQPEHGIVHETLKPVHTLLRVFGLFPIANIGDGIFRVTPKWMGYSVALFLFVAGYIGYIKWDKVEIVRSAEGRFEEAVIDYLFTVYLVPIVINPLIWYESRKLAKVITDWIFFEKVYMKVVKKNLPLFLGNKPLFITIALPVVSCAAMVVTHVTMVHFRFLQVIPYCYINTVTYLVGGFWFVQCDIIGKVATAIADDFQSALKHVGPSAQVADYRSLWMMLSKLIRDVGNSSGYTLTFLCLYLFLIITLTIYGLLSQIQEGLGVKDIGLTITAGFAIAILYFICDEAHYASNCVRVQFQKKLLLVELTWMNDDAQQEINMFLRATEMSPTDMSLGGFFDVNRTLFKSLLATMVTYLVVLLQFQISIPEDTMADLNMTFLTATTTTTTAAPK